MSAAWMFLAGGLLGLVVGACLGVVIAGLLLQSPDDDTPEVVDAPSTYGVEPRWLWIVAALLSSIGAAYAIHVFGLVTS